MSAKLLYTVLTEQRLELPDTAADLRGRVLIITGANSGLGFAAAKRFYEMNPARLILAVRTINKGEVAKQEILASGTGSTATKVDVWELDLASFDSVRAFGRRCESGLERLDILVENGGFIPGKWTVTKDGWEAGLQVNVLSVFLLAGLLGPLMAKTAKLPIEGGADLKPHLVVVTSNLYLIASLSEKNKPNIFEALNTESLYKQRERYRLTKLLNLMLTQRLATLPLFRHVVVCSVSPGICRTELLKDVPSLQKKIAYALWAARTSDTGARTYTWAALTNDIPPGSYTSSCRVVTNLSGVMASCDIEITRSRLWMEMSDILSKEAPHTQALWAA